MNRSKIPYLTHVWNPTTGCSPVSSGCASCWASAYHRRWRKSFVPTVHPEKLDEPLRLRKPSTIGVALLGDLFHDDVPDGFFAQVYATMALCPRHTFVVLTKRPENLRSMLTAKGFYDLVLGAANFQRYTKTRMQLSMVGVSDPAIIPLPNVFLGVSAEDQATADERIPILLDTPAAHRWVSLEPQIGAVDLEAYLPRKSDCDGCAGPRTGGCDSCHPESTIDRDGLDLVIQGAESGPHRRPFDLQWARDCRDQCKAAGVPFALKQMPVAGRVMEKPGLDDELCWELPWKEGQIDG